ncbi:DUF2905 domain-containing protein [Chroogloeocystis siderophila]|uniref:DUF2905 domain-containing protein n=1 Tax=Chroogloeocystis siderophila 5.2 s.c.1 TaxID=247279 RepID=A0A1U7HUD8_9CHRO|nr:DUF2905 domain-containing protein [Chroogloeocystis siderophila]OKH27202.1 hypothetical protein NIES1031_10610 [Chroogloeocystis siderophila 5.2 s.c.1]
MIAEIGKTLVAVGAGVLLLGGLLWLSSGTFKHFPIGRLPGDILIQNEHITFYFPLATSILLSIVLSLLIWIWQSVIR